MNTKLTLNNITKQYPNKNIVKNGTHGYLVDSEKFKNLTDLVNYLETTQETMLLETTQEITQEITQETTNLNSEVKSNTIVVNLDTEEKEYFLTTKLENKEVIAENLNNNFNYELNPTNIVLSQLELLSVASDLTGISKEEIIKQALEMYCQKLITVNSKPNDFTEVELRIVETIYNLISQLSNGIIKHFTKTRVIQLSFSNPKTVDKLLDRLGIAEMVKNKITSDNLESLKSMLPKID